MTIGRAIIICITALIATTVVIRPIRGQAPKPNSVEQELVHTEFGFFEAWKSQDEAYFRAHIPANGVIWSDAGTFSLDQQLEGQKAAAKSCKVQGYGLSDFGVLPLSSGVYLLTYKAEQYATCTGEKLPVHLNGSSVYIFKDGRWQAIYRASVPMKTQG